MMTLGNVENWNKNRNELTIKTSEGLLGLSFVAEDILRLRFNPGKTLVNEDTYVILDPPKPLPFEVASNGKKLILSSMSLRVEVRLEPLSMKVFREPSQPLVETPSPGMGEYRYNRSGQLETTILRFKIQPDEKIYGLGQDPMGKLDHRDQERRMWQEWGAFDRSGNAGVPFMISSRGYAVLLNSSWASRFAIGRAVVALPGPAIAESWAPAPWGWEVSSGETHPDQMAILLDEGNMDVFILCRPSVDELLAGYVDLTGHAPMPPKWALGFIQCKNRYRSQDELLYQANQFQQRKIPLDVLVIDWLWFKEFGDLEWLKSTFSDAKAALKTLAEMGIHVMQAQHPYIDKASSKYAEFRDQGFLNHLPEDTPQNRPTFDHTNPAARRVWWSDHIRRFFDDGIRGYWTDMGELEVHPRGTMSALGKRERVHNIYSLLWTKGLYEGQRMVSKERVFSLPRTAYAGIQRFGAAMWSGDISSSWQVLLDQVVIGQGVALSGQQYWTTDIGGFMPHPDFSPELYIRWFQWGTFCPIFRTHGTRPDNEPWSFGPEAEAILVDLIRLRYRLLPYIYSCARQVSLEGTPLMRAMCVDFPDDPVAVAQERQFMFGPAILVAPILEEGARTQRVYLPEGEWYDFWTDKRYAGKQWIQVSAPLSRIPLFVWAGSLVPMGPEIQNVGEKIDCLEIHAYPGLPGAFEFYDDDGLTYAYEEGEFTRALITMDGNGEVDVEELSGKLPEYRIVTHGGEPAEAHTMEVDSNLSFDGRCTVNVLLVNPGSQPAQVKPVLKAPAGWKVVSGPRPEIVVQDRVHLVWKLTPVAEALPLIQRGRLQLEIRQGEKVTPYSQEVRWGSGYATRWSLIGEFDNQDGQALERILPVEINPDLPTYIEGNNTLRWTRDLSNEFNCFGYVDLRVGELVNGRGAAFAKSRIWSDKDQIGFMEVSADPNIKLWLNGEQVFHSARVVLRRILPWSVSLKQGWNTVLVKATLAFDKPWSGREQGFNFRMVDKDGQVMEDLLYGV